MTASRRNEDDVFAKAREALRQATPTEKLELLRRAGALADRPQLGDKIVARDVFGDPRFAIVVGVDTTRHLWMVVRNAEAGVELVPLETFAGGATVELVERAPEGGEAAAVKAALELRGKASDLANFRYPDPRQRDVGAGLMALAGAFGLGLAASWLLRDRSWDEDTGRYRDHLGRFTR